MYPNLYYLFKDLFGVEWNWLKAFGSFGFFVVIAFITAVWILALELKRKQSQGLFTYAEKIIEIGKPASFTELFFNFLLGFIVGYKLIGILVTPNALNYAQLFMFSLKGSLLYGLFMGIVFAVIKWFEKNKNKLTVPEKHTIKIWPLDRIGDLLIYAVIFGFAGAKVFDSLEHWDNFIRAPISSLLSFSGLTFYGGLICASFAIYFYARKHKMKPIIHLSDSIAPSLIIAYAIGRIGCHISGDGDWGILNTALISNNSGILISSSGINVNSLIKANGYYYAQRFATFNHVQALQVNPFWGLPGWLFGYNYPHNVINEGMNIAGCEGNYCHVLPISVFPTAFYETIICLILFAILWILRRRNLTPGKISGIYLIMNGVERFFIEKIRINIKYSILGFHPTQAEIISTCLIVGGIVLIIFSKKWFGKFSINTSTI